MSTPPRPAVSPSPPWSFPVAERTRLDNGIDVLLYRLPGQHVVAAGLSLDLPLTAEPTHLEGVAALTARTLDEGTRDHPGQSFAEAVERCGAELSAGVGYSGTHLFLDVPASRVDAALHLLGEAVTAPLLADADVDRHRTLRLAQVEQQLAQSSERANHAFRRTIIRDADRCSRMTDGEAATLASVTGDDVRAFHDAHYGPAGATLVLAGDFHGDPLPAAAAALGAWRPGQRRTDHEVPGPRTPLAHLVDRPGSVQADVRLGWFTVDRRDPRWFDLQVGARAVGGSFLSRLNRVLREEKGFTYGVHLVNAPMRVGGLSYVTGSFRNEVVGETLDLLPRLLDVANDPLSPAEVSDARTYLTDVLPLQYATASGVCNGAMALIAAGLGPEFVDATRAGYARSTATSATHAVAELLRPHAASLVVVGDAGVLEAGIRDAGWEVEVVGVGTWI